jgi:hypothetical protein
MSAVYYFIPFICLFWIGCYNIGSLFFILSTFYLCGLVVIISTVVSNLFIVSFAIWLSYPLLILLATLV